MMRKQIFILAVILIGLLYSACGDYGITNRAPISLHFNKQDNFARIADASIKALVVNGFRIIDNGKITNRISGEKGEHRINIYLYNTRGGFLGLENVVDITICEYYIDNDYLKQSHEIDVDEQASSIKKNIEENLKK